MNKNILLLKNNVTDLTTINSGLSLAQTWCKTIGLNLTFTQVTTTHQFSSIPFSNTTNANGYMINPTEIFQQAKTFNIPFDFCLLIYDASKETPNPTNPEDCGQNMQISTQWYNGYPDVLAQFTLHELCHAFFSGQNKLLDITHLMVNRPLNPILYDQFAQQPIQNFYLYLLKQFMPTQPTVTLTRTSDDGKETLGQLVVGNKEWGCYTLEKPWLNNQLNISCVPKGTYQCIWAYMGTLKEWHYELQNTGTRTGIFIHQGTFNTNTEGCILLGGLLQDLNGDGEKDLGNSKMILSAFETKMAKQPFTLKIV